MLQHKSKNLEDPFQLAFLCSTTNVPNDKWTIGSKIKELCESTPYQPNWVMLVVMHATVTFSIIWIIAILEVESFFATQHFTCHITWLCNKTCKCFLGSKKTMTNSLYFQINSKIKLEEFYWQLAVLFQSKASLIYSKLNFLVDNSCFQKRQS